MPACMNDEGEGRGRAENGDPSHGTGSTFQPLEHRYVDQSHQDDDKIDMESREATPSSPGSETSNNQSNDQTNNQSMPVSVAYLDQAIAGLVRTLQPTDKFDEVFALQRRIRQLEAQHSDDQAEIAGLQYLKDDLRAESVELEQGRCRDVEETLKKTLDANVELTMERDIAQAKVTGLEKCIKATHEALSRNVETLKQTMEARVAAAENDRMKDDRDYWSQGFMNARGKFPDAEECPDEMRAEIRALQELVGKQRNTIREQGKIIRERETLDPTGTRLVDRTKKQDLHNKRKIDKLTQERDADLTQDSILSCQRDGSLKRPRSE